MNEDFYEGTELSAAYRSLQTSVGATEGERVSSGVERIDASHVRIDVGDSDVLSSWMKLGVGVGPGYLGASSTRTSTEGTMRSVDLDITTPAGWRRGRRTRPARRSPPGSPRTS